MAEVFAQKQQQQPAQPASSSDFVRSPLVLCPRKVLGSGRMFILSCFFSLATSVDSLLIASRVVIIVLTVCACIGQKTLQVFSFPQFLGDRQ
jgi:hypothetical protein